MRAASHATKVCRPTTWRCTPGAIPRGPARNPDRYPFWPKADLEAYERERLDVARDVLRSFLAVGTVERLAETLELVRARGVEYGFRLLPADAVPHINVTGVSAGDVSWIDRDPFGERIRAAIAVDEELYAFANELLDASAATIWEPARAS